MPQSLHNPKVLEAVLPAFKWLTFGGFCLGLIESFLYGVYAGLVFVPIYNFLARYGSADQAERKPDSKDAGSSRAKGDAAGIN